MPRHHERVFTDQADIARLERYVRMLIDGTSVALHLEDGSVVGGIVSMQPSVQVFLDAEGREGINGLVRLSLPAMDDPQMPGFRDVWLGEIREVRVLKPGAAPMPRLDTGSD